MFSSARSRAFRLFVAAFVLLTILLSGLTAAALPPGTPNTPTPADGAQSAGNPLFQWQASGASWYYLYLDWFSTTQPLKVVTEAKYQLPWTLAEGTYTWHVEATDGYGGWSTGPTWTFIVGPGAIPNLPPDAPHQPTPANGSIDRPTEGLLQWHASDPDNQPLKFDVYFGTEPTPPSTGNNDGYNVTSYDAGPFAFNTTYYWRVVARDPAGAETSSPTWSFKTKMPNEPPDVPVLIAPSNGATQVPANPFLQWQGSDPEYQPVNFDVYFGPEADPPLVVDHTNLGTYTPPVLAPGTQYHWRIVARDPSALETTSPTWDFTTANTINLMPETPYNRSPVSSNQGGSYPYLSWDSADPDDAYLPGDTLRFDVYFGAYLGSNIPSPADPLPRIATTTAHTLQVGPLVQHARYYWRVVARDNLWTARGPLWFFDNGTVPVLFSRFDARQSGANVEVDWKLQSDEAMESYSLFRHEGAGPATGIVTGAVQGVEGSYVDKSVTPGKTYRYELLIRTSDGDEYRSPIAMVATAALGLTLYQNVPNPFNPVTTIRYDLPSSERVQLSIVDVSGRRVRILIDELQPPGSRDVIWNGRDDAGRAVASGVYFSVLEAGKQRLTKKLVLLK